MIYVWPVVFGLFIPYVLTGFLVKKNKITLQFHRKIWNSLLLVCFLVTAVLGILMALGIYPNNSLQIHAEFGVALATIAVFHILWHLYFFKGIFMK
jgi:hypothetical protein